MSLLGGVTGGLLDLAEELKHGSVGDGLSEGLKRRDLLKFVFM